MKLYDSIKIEIAKNESEKRRLKNHIKECGNELREISDDDLDIYDFSEAAERITASVKTAVEKIGELIRSNAVLKEMLKKADEESREEENKMIDDLIINFGGNHRKWERKFEGKEDFSKAEKLFLQELFKYGAKTTKGRTA